VGDEAVNHRQVTPWGEKVYRAIAVCRPRPVRGTAPAQPRFSGLQKERIIMDRNDETRPVTYRETSMFGGRDAPDTRGLDIAALVATMLMILGPLAAGAFSSL
jgi:hypothetical protein